MLKTLISSVVILVVAWIAAYQFENTPALGYQVSDPIEIGNQLGNPEYVQQIAVFNTGRVMVKAVSIKVPHGISSYQLQKHTNLAKEASINGPARFELLYPELPPDQRISLVVLYEGSPIPREWITVFSDGGYVQPQEMAIRQINPVVVAILFLSGFMFSLLLQIRKQRQNDFIHAATDEELLCDNKPWFVTRAEWPNVQHAAIAMRLSLHHAPESPSSFAYKVLNHEKPLMLRGEQWGELKLQACDSLLFDFSRISKQGPTKTTLLELLGLIKPEMLPWHAWKKFQGAVSERLFELLLPHNPDEADFERLLAPGAIAMHDIPEQLAHQLRSTAQEQYLSRLIVRTTESWSDSWTILQTARLDFLNDNQKRSFQQFIKQLARMRAMPRHWDLAELREFIASGRPEWMPEAEYSAIGKLVDRLENMNDEWEILTIREQQARHDQIDADIQRKRALAQLGLIDRVLMSPEAVDTLEDYDQAFDPCYRRSLERVAWLLRRANSPTMEKKILASLNTQGKLRERG